MRGKRAKELRRFVESLGVGGHHPSARDYSIHKKHGQIIATPYSPRSYYQAIKKQYKAGGRNGN